MRVHELIDVLMTRCNPDDYVFVNAKPAAMTLHGTSYVTITDHMIEYRSETVTINGEEYEPVRRM